MEADGLEVLWVIGLTRTREGGVRERAAAAVPKPREEGMGRRGLAWLMLREREGGSSARCVKEDGARQPTIAWVRQRLRSVGHMPREAGEELGAWAAAVVGSA
jgi:hypothetical protein